jgi:hypothetical protein
MDTIIMSIASIAFNLAIPERESVLTLLPINQFLILRSRDS